jgi:membrane protease YdiL (CAAX protease family)
MNDELEPLPPVVTLAEPPTVAPAPRKGFTRLSWCVILAAVGGIITFHLLPSAKASEQKSVVLARLDLKGLRLQAEMAIAIRHLAPDTEMNDLIPPADQGKTEASKALATSAVVAELAGPAEALRRLEAWEPPPTAPLTPEQQRVREILTRLYKDQAGGLFYHPSVTEAEAQFLQQELGWFGKLALHPFFREETVEHAATQAGAEGPELLQTYREAREAIVNAAVPTLIITMSLGVCMLAALTFGMVGLPIFVLLWGTGYIRVGLSTGITHAGVYAETFAIWLVFYFGLSTLAMLFLEGIPMIARAAVAMPASLLVVGWPVLRGVPWRQVRQDIGWTLGRRPLLEPFCGFLCYVLNLPIVMVGFVLMFVLLLLYAGLNAGTGPVSEDSPSHPIIGIFEHATWFDVITFFIVISVLAPIIEETMFRGFLHRHLREVAFPRYALLSGLFSMLVVNVIFASIHPQGLLAVPVLTAMACGFSLAREWRGTLIPSMVAHGTNNFIAGILMVLLFWR